MHLSFSSSPRGSDKPESEIVAEIRHLIRQITQCVTFLPLLECPCSFDLLVYTDKSARTPSKWEESEAKYISDAEELRLRSFTTKVFTSFSISTHIPFEI
eukprot:TRINITY_DN4221_c0_g1_i1.p3 TRINITY_DN4221_c0_g1~~TRINITY_DN4221_c0_g1_i1.p3  ORF type:complete len:100 (-),score=18.05 TRINITY_DN4221_c0_g1_i1:540-839(-)